MLQIAEHAARIQQFVNLRVKRSLAFVHDVMNGKAGDDRIKLPERGKSLIEIVGDHVDRRIPGKPFSHSFQHRWREIDCHGFGVRVLAPDQRQQATIARTEVENAPRVCVG